MKIQKTLLWIAGCALAYAISICGSGCAQVGMPIGGPKDTLPPVLVNANPANRTTGFRSDRIVFTFNEYVQLDNALQKLIVSPVSKRTPNVDFKLRTVTVRLRDTLEPNTTYKIELGNAVRDINENNPYPDFTYVFSTGSYIDSLKLAGNVILAETGGVDTTLIVMLYNDLSDSAVFKEKPRYITRVDNQGAFNFSNLPPGTFHMFALKDDAGQRRYTNLDQTFAFADDPVSPSQSPEPVTLYAYAEEEPEGANTSTNTVKASDTLKVTAASSGAQDLLTPLTLSFNKTLGAIDSAAIKVTDTLFNPVPFRVAFADTLHRTVNIEVPWQESFDYFLIIQPQFATDTTGKTLAEADTIKLRTKREADYGSIKLTFSNLDKVKNPVLQIVKSKKVVASHPLAGSVFSQKLIEPGDYELRILADENQNGIWDPGHYNPAAPETQKQPERVIAIPQTLTIKAGWDNERDIIL